MWCLPRISFQKPHHMINTYVKHPIFLGHPIFNPFWGRWFHVVLQPSWAPTCRWWVRSATQSPPRIPVGWLDFRCICWILVFHVKSKKYIRFYTFIWYCYWVIHLRCKIWFQFCWLNEGWLIRAKSDRMSLDPLVSPSTMIHSFTACLTIYDSNTAIIGWKSDT